MAPAVSALCVQAPKAVPNNPHAYFTVYVNKTGRATMLGQAQGPFPVGTVIVKEKFSSLKSKEPQLLTVMIKRGKGYDVRQEDWEYLALDGQGRRFPGKQIVSHCQSCHQNSALKDHVYRNYINRGPVLSKSLPKHADGKGR